MAATREPDGSTGSRRRGRPTASSGTDTRQRILDTAQRRFGDLGYRGLSVEQLARDLGLDGRAIYHYFPSKQALFQAAAESALQVYADGIRSRVLVHDDLRGRLHAFVDLYRSLFSERRFLLAFISMVMIEGITAAGGADPQAAGGDAGGASVDTAGLSAVAAPVLALNGLVVDQATARGELAASVDGGAAAALIRTVGMGLGLASLDAETPFLPMLDVLDLLIDGTLLTP